MPIKLNDIKKEMMKFPRDPEEYPNLRLKKLESLASPGIKSFTYKGVIAGETDSYTTIIQFFEVMYNSARSLVHTEPTTVAKKAIYYAKPSIKNNKVSLKCSCPDFRFTWEKELYDSHSLIGNFRKYQRVVPDSGRPPRNPMHYVGLCKHVWGMLSSLRESKRITD